VPHPLVQLERLRTGSIRDLVTGHLFASQPSLLPIVSHTKTHHALSPDSLVQSPSHPEAPCKETGSSCSSRNSALSGHHWRQQRHWQGYCVAPCREGRFSVHACKAILIQAAFSTCTLLQGWKVFAGVRKQEDGQQLQLQHTGKGGSIVPVVSEDGRSSVATSTMGLQYFACGSSASCHQAGDRACDVHKCICRSLM
jgi:hypothetical protein